MIERTLFALLAAASLFATPADHPRVDADGRRLVAGNGVVLKELTESTEFQGYGLVGDDLLFVAYSSDTEGGASTHLSLFNLADAKEHHLCELGATGESSFAVNRSAGVVAFNWDGGIYVMTVPDLLRVQERSLDCASLQRKFERIRKCGPCYEVHWVSDSRLAYREFDGKCWQIRELEYRASGGR
jgi:hypothetical protein